MLGVLALIIGATLVVCYRGLGVALGIIIASLIVATKTFTFLFDTISAIITYISNQATTQIQTFGGIIKGLQQIFDGLVKFMKGNFFRRFHRCIFRNW